MKLDLIGLCNRLTTDHHLMKWQQSRWWNGAWQRLGESSSRTFETNWPLGRVRSFTLGKTWTNCGRASSCDLCWTVNYGCGDRHTIFHLTGTICWSRDLSLTRRWTWSSTCEHLHRHDDDDDHHDDEDHEDDIEDDHNCGLQDDPQSHTSGGFWPDD